MSAPIKAAHAAIALSPDAQIQEVRINFLPRRQDLSHVPPIHEVVGEGSGMTVVPSYGHRFPEEVGELDRIHLPDAIANSR